MLQHVRCCTTSGCDGLHPLSIHDGGILLLPARSCLQEISLSHSENTIGQAAPAAAAFPPLLPRSASLPPRQHQHQRVNRTISDNSSDSGSSSSSSAVTLHGVPCRVSPAVATTPGVSSTATAATAVRSPLLHRNEVPSLPDSSGGGAQEGVSNGSDCGSPGGGGSASNPQPPLAAVSYAAKLMRAVPHQSPPSDSVGDSSWGPQGSPPDAAGAECPQQQQEEQEQQRPVQAAPSLTRKLHKSDVMRCVFGAQDPFSLTSEQPQQQPMQAAAAAPAPVVALLQQMSQPVAAGSATLEQQLQVCQTFAVWPNAPRPACLGEWPRQRLMSYPVYLLQGVLQGVLGDQDALSSTLLSLLLPTAAARTALAEQQQQQQQRPAAADLLAAVSTAWQVGGCRWSSRVARVQC